MLHVLVIMLHHTQLEVNQSALNVSSLVLPQAIFLPSCFCAIGWMDPSAIFPLFLTNIIISL